MAKEELEREAEEYRLNLVTKLRPKLQEGCNCKELVDIKKAYLAGAEPREKRIAELEAQIEKMKCCANCKKYWRMCEYGDREMQICDKWELRR